MRRLFKVGARGSALSRAQTAGALARFEREFPGCRFRFVPVETPGDRDRTTPIDRAAPDFFTRDLDDAVRSGALDFAVHSAKDLPDPVPEGLDWFWLPEPADPRDAWVSRTQPFPPPRAHGGKGLAIGVSGERRAAYARRILPRATLRPVRGAIDDRMRQVASGAFDAVLMAMAGIDRLGLDVSALGLAVTPIPVTELEPPEAQGVLAVTFRAGDRDLMAMRRRFVKAVRFTSAGTGDPDYLTRVGARDIDEADVVLHDELLGGAFAGAKFRFVGKRCGAHSLPQAAITRLLCDEVRKGRRVVRLKGGDAGLFGRLAEETSALTALDIPFVVRPGVSALTVATTGTGILLTRRGEARGFTVETPRSTGPETPYVAFMASRATRETARRLVAAGWRRNTPCALVLDAGGPREEIVRGTLVRPPVTAADETRPGLFIAGAVTEHAWPARPRLLLTCSEAVLPRAVRLAEDAGWKPLVWPLIRLVPRREGLWDVAALAAYDAVVLTSPAAVRIFFDRVTGDRRRIPALWTCGAGTDAEVRRYGLASDLMPVSDFSAKGLIARIAEEDLSGKRILRLRSAKAGTAVARAIRRAGAVCDDRVLYDNVPAENPGALPPFDGVFFASASAVEAFLARYGARALGGKRLFAMGGPTRAALPERLRGRAETILNRLLDGRGNEPWTMN